jgi:hypothetical protein
VQVTAKSRTLLGKPESLLLFKKNILVLNRAKFSDLKVF